jgi:hypothetical protein
MRLYGLVLIAQRIVILQLLLQEFCPVFDSNPWILNPEVYILATMNDDSLFKALDVTNPSSLENIYICIYVVISYMVLN